MGDKFCDDKANNEACEFDKGDCCLPDSQSKKYCTECLCKESKTCDASPRNLGDNFCDDEANNEACEFDKGDCCLLEIESKRYFGLINVIACQRFSPKSLIAQLRENFYFALRL